MNARPEPAPPPVIRRPRVVDRLVWLAPLLAAAAAAWYAWGLRAERGPEVELTFADATGVRDDTAVEHLGVAIGRVAGIALTGDARGAVVTVRLRRGEEGFARAGARYWLVRPGLSGAGLTGLEALASGPYIEARPGDGAPVRELPGGAEPPPEPGLSLTLVAPARGPARLDAPVAYRGVRVGTVRDARLSGSADAVELRVLIERRYAPLVRARSRFWTAPGLDVKGGLVRGLEVRLDSAARLLTGEIDFATPEKDAGAPARDGDRFALAEKPEKEWLGWSPRIPIRAQGERESERERPLPSGRDVMSRKGG